MTVLSVGDALDRKCVETGLVLYQEIFMIRQTTCVLDASFEKFSLRGNVRERLQQGGSLEKEHVWMGLERQSLMNSCFFTWQQAWRSREWKVTWTLRALRSWFFLKTSSVEFKVDCVEVISLLQLLCVSTETELVGVMNQLEL